MFFLFGKEKRPYIQRPYSMMQIYFSKLFTLLFNSIVNTLLGVCQQSSQQYRRSTPQLSDHSLQQDDRCRYPP